MHFALVYPFTAITDKAISYGTDVAIKPRSLSQFNHTQIIFGVFPKSQKYQFSFYVLIYWSTFVWKYFSVPALSFCLYSSTICKYELHKRLG